MPDTESLYKEVVKITQDYLGPAADRFVGRQIETHLKKKPEAITKADVAKLADWIKIAIALLTEDTNTVNEYTKRLLALSK